jgi:hypothetical protein
VKAAIAVIPIGLYMVVGLVSLTMAYKSILSKGFLPFHEEAAGKSWDKIGTGLQFVVIALMRVSGIGFLVVGCQLTIFPIVDHFNHDPFVHYAIPAISLLYCFGLFLINHQLSIKTRARTPWRGSLCAAVILALGIIISWIPLC